MRTTWSLLQQHIDFGMAWKGALVLGVAVFAINYVDHGALAALPAALKQAAYTFFVAEGGLLRTGPTGTNVNDLVLVGTT